jgi:methylglutaconyl-CoA hydratase
MLTVFSDARGVGHLVLSRPDVHNALSQSLIKSLTYRALELDNDPKIRLLALYAEGQSFCAGADLSEMQTLGTKSFEENLNDAEALGTLFHTLNSCKKPIIIKAKGAVMGGGVGLLACADYVLMHPETKLSLSEVKLGIIPAVISPFLIAKIGVSQAHALFISAERFSGQKAYEIGLAHRLALNIDEEFETLICDMLACAPKAQMAAKALINSVANKAIDTEILRETAMSIASMRAAPEAQEGLTAFLEKRSPQWVLTPLPKAPT